MQSSPHFVLRKAAQLPLIYESKNTRGKEENFVRHAGNIQRGIMCIELIERITIGKVVKDKTAEREIHIYYSLWITAILKNYIQTDLIAHLQYSIPREYGVS